MGPGEPPSRNVTARRRSDRTGAAGCFPRRHVRRPAAASFWAKIKIVRNATHVYAVVRIDLWPEPEDNWQDRVTVKEILWSLDDAKAEVDRLNALNSVKGCHYFWQTT